MKDRIIAAVEVFAVVLILAAVMPRGGRQKALEKPAPAAPLAAVDAAPAAAPAPVVEAPTVAKEAPAAPAPAPVVVAAPVRAPAPAPAAAPAAASAAASGALKQYWGVIDAIDPAALTLAVKDKKGRVYSLKLHAATEVTVGGENKKGALKDLKPGDSVTVTTEDGAAREVHVRVMFTDSGARVGTADSRA